MRLSSLADYAVLMMSAAARHCGVGAAIAGHGVGAAIAGHGVGAAARGRPARLNATALSEETGIPLPTAQKLVSRLSAAGLLESTRGTGGGVRLSRPPAAISLADIVEAVEGPIAMTACVDAGRDDCALEDCCTVRPHMGVVNNVIRDALASVTLADLSSAGTKAGAVKTEPKAPAFAGAQLS